MVNYQRALSSAGAELVRMARLPSGIVLAEWSGSNTYTAYEASPENVLSVYLSKGENCSQIRGSRAVRRGFKDAICLFPAGEGRSQWRINGRLNFLHLYFDPGRFETGLLSSIGGDARLSRFREAFQEASPVISTAARSVAHADWTDSSMMLGLDGVVSWILLNVVKTYSSTGLEPHGRAEHGRFTPRQRALIRDWLADNLSEVVRLEQLASLVNISRYHFLRKFSRTFGQSPHAMLTQMRMQRAYELLASSDLKISMIALECGYGQHSHFTVAFKRHFGHAPSQVRRR
ncbi:helix-turn-helix domain-containing protein [Burkholderia ubonensis]|nr:AraC family transcriptional regulator [Burkholderia ubonensis]